MNVKKSIKKIIALGTTAAFIGATVLGAASAATLADYPAPFVKDGQWNNALIVLGDDAAAEDVVGAIDIGVNLQKGAVTPFAATSTNILEGDSQQIVKGSNMLEFNELAGDVLSVISSSHLELLEDGEVRSNSGNGKYTQKLLLENSGMEVVYAENDDEVLADYLKLDSGDEIYTYELFFTETLQSDVEDGELIDIDGKAITMLGNDYTIVKATPTVFTLMGGHSALDLYEGETKTVEIDGIDYEITVSVISDMKNSVKLSVNGESTDEMFEGQTHTLSSGTVIGVKEVIPNEAGDITHDSVSIYVGANKLVLANGQELEINNNDVDETLVTITSSGTDEVIVTSIEVQAMAEDDIYLPSGEVLSSYLDDKNSLINDNWDILYDGLSVEETSLIKLSPKGNDEYVLTFSNVNGQEINLPLAYNDGAGNLLLGKEDDTNNKPLVLGENVSITDEDYFIVNDEAGKTNGETRAFQFKDIDLSDELITLKDLGSGDTFNSYFANVTTPKILNKWNFEVVGNDILVDLNGDGSIDTGDTAVIAAQYESVIGITEGANNVTVSVTVSGEKVDGLASTATESISFTIGVDGEEVDVIEFKGDVDMQSANSDDVTTGYTDLYGAFVKRNSDDSDKITIDFPENQLEPLVYVNAGEVVSKVLGDAVIVDQISGEAAKLASEVDAPSSNNLILVGGPCANPLVEELTDLRCDTWDLGENQALIKLFANGDNVAMVVAGTTATGTRTAVSHLLNNELIGDSVILG